MMKLILEKYDEFRDAQMHKSPLIWGYDFTFRHLSVLGIHILTFSVGLILLYFNVKINFYLGMGVYILLIFTIIDSFNEEITSIYDNYSIINEAEEKKLKYNVLLSLFISLCPAILIIFFFYESVLSQMYFNTLWLGILYSFILFMTRKTIVDTYYYEVRSLYEIDILGESIKVYLFRIKNFLYSLLGPFVFKIYYLVQLIFIIFAYIIFIPIGISILVYSVVFMFSWFFRYNYKDIWVIQKIESLIQLNLKFITNFLDVTPEQIIFYTNIVIILLSFIFFLIDIYVFVVKGTRYKIELLFKRYTPEMEEGTLNTRLIPISEYKRSSNYNSSANTQNVNLMIKENIAINLLITKKLSDLEICEILQITPFDLQKYKKIIRDR